MQLLPLVPSVHPSVRLAGAGLAGRQALCEAVLARDGHACRFCGLPAGGWQDVFHLDDDRANWSEGNLAAACPLCVGVQHLGGPAANDDFRVIWLPELTQNLLNAVVRGIHLAFHARGAAPTLARRPERDDPELALAWRAYAALDRRAAGACAAIDTSEPRALAAALLALSPRDYARRGTLLGGLRLLHRGTRVRGGQDTYPVQLAAWAAPTREAVGPVASGRAQGTPFPARRR